MSDTAQSLCESYDRVEIPEIQPDVTRVSLFGGVCPCCAKRFKAEPPAGLEPGSPFGPNLRAFVVYLRSVQGIPLARLSHVLRDLFGLEISEGALVNILSASRKPFAAQTSLIKARLMAGTALASDETGMRVGKANWWLWVFHHRDSAVFVADKPVWDQPAFEAGTTIIDILDAGFQTRRGGADFSDARAGPGFACTGWPTSSE